MEEVLVPCRDFESPLPERIAGAPQVQESWSSKGPDGKQVEAILHAIAIVKKKGVTRDHVVFSFIGRQTQPPSCESILPLDMKVCRIPLGCP